MLTRTRSVFFSVSVILACIICAGGCIVMRSFSGASEYYWLYLVFLIGGSLLGGALSAIICRLLGGTDEPQKKARRSKTSEAQEIEKLKADMEALQDAADRREEFIASFAHELKTPLTAIIGYADMLRSKDMSPKSRFTAAGYIFSEGKRLEALSLKLMDIIVAGKQGFETKKFEVGFFIRSVAAVTVPSLSNEGMTLDMHWEPGEVWIEPDLFKTLMINLVDNARKASPKNSTIELTGKAEEGGYAFYVVDHGRGMKQEDLAKITEPFYMIDKSRSRAQNGAGLGLALGQKIAELHGSKLEYSSELGKGTTVRVFLKDKEADI